MVSVHIMRWTQCTYTAGDVQLQDAVQVGIQTRNKAELADIGRHDCTSEHNTVRERRVQLGLGIDVDACRERRGVLSRCTARSRVPDRERLVVRDRDRVGRVLIEAAFA